MMFPARVFHIVESLDTGAVENWLLRMLEFAVRRGEPIDWTFYCILQQPGQKNGHARRLGAKVIHSPVPLNDKFRFAKALRAELQRGEYDVLHCHHDLVSGMYLLTAVGVKLNRRIVHVHNADENVPSPSKLKQLIYRPLLRKSCLVLADQIVGISNHTLDTFLAGRSRRPQRDVVHYYGIDASPFEGPAPDRAEFRRGLNLPADARLLLFGGRIVPEKNPLFAVWVLAELHKTMPNAYGVFVGAGSLEEDCKQLAEDLGVTDTVHFLGWRNDLQKIMRCCDWFILPRPEKPLEGLGIAVVEAQLAGLRLLLSCGIADDALLPGAVAQRIPLKSGPARWAQVAVEQLSWKPPVHSGDHSLLETTPFDMDRGLTDLQQMHSQGLL